MAAASPALKTSALAAVGSAALAVGYAAVIERNAFVVREVTMPVLTPGSTPLRVLHLSDIHMRPTQKHKQAWLRELARWLYRRLEDEYACLTSDDAVDEAIAANEYTFTEAGLRAG